MQTLSGPGNVAGFLTPTIPRADFYTLGLELDAPSIPTGTPPPLVNATVSAGNSPHRSATAVIVSSQPKNTASAADVYLEPGDTISYSIQALNGASSVAWTARVYLHDGGSDIA